MDKKRILFYVLQWTWGLPMNIIGGIVALLLIAVGYKPIKHANAYLFRIGKGWGGVCLGMFILVAGDLKPERYNHEYGHSVQNALYGVFFPFLVAIPSAVRYWYREIRNSLKKPCKSLYDDVWFERQATEWGNEHIERWGK